MTDARTELVALINTVVNAEAAAASGRPTAERQRRVKAANALLLEFLDRHNIVPKEPR